MVKSKIIAKIIALYKIYRGAQSIEGTEGEDYKFEDFLDGDYIKAKTEEKIALHQIGIYNRLVTTISLIPKKSVVPFYEYAVLKGYSAPERRSDIDWFNICQSVADYLLEFESFDGLKNAIELLLSYAD